jgi:hypothetical protein
MLPEASQLAAPRYPRGHSIDGKLLITIPPLVEQEAEDRRGLSHAF